MTREIPVPHTAYKTFAVPSSDSLSYLYKQDLYPNQVCLYTCGICNGQLKQDQYARAAKPGSPPLEAASAFSSYFNSKAAAVAKEDSASSLSSSSANSSHVSSIPKFISRISDSNTTSLIGPLGPRGGSNNTYRTHPIAPVSISSQYTYHSHRSASLPCLAKVKKKCKGIMQCAWAPCVFLPSTASKMACLGSLILLLLALLCLVTTVLVKFEFTQLKDYFWVFLVAAASCLGAALLTWNVMTICKWRQQGRYNQELFEESLD